jgi:putative nucleotidyltransferase with HDIG domain
VIDTFRETVGDMCYMEIQAALAMVDQYIVSPGLRAHCVGVAKAARVIAQALERSGQRVNVERTTCMGLIHDLGRERFNNDHHGIEGYKLARQLGVPTEIACICLTHNTVGRTSVESVAIGLLTEMEACSLADEGLDLTALSVEEQIVCLADSHVLKGEFASLSERIAELEGRRGPLTPHDWYNLNEIAEFVRRFEQILNHPLTDSFRDKKLAEISFYS